MISRCLSSDPFALSVDSVPIPSFSAQHHHGISKHASSFFSCVDPDSDIRVKINDRNVRILEFLSEPGYTQSEVRCSGKALAAKHELSKEPSCHSSEALAAGKCQDIDFQDKSSLSQYALRLLRHAKRHCEDKEGHGLFLGLGGGGMQSYLQQNCAHTPDIITVDNSKQVLETAENFFGFRRSSHNHVLIGDAYRELARFREQGKKFDFIVFDTLPTAAPPGAVKDAFRALKPGGELLVNWDRRRKDELEPYFQTAPQFEEIQSEDAHLNYVLSAKKPLVADPSVHEKQSAQIDSSSNRPGGDSPHHFTFKNVKFL